MAMAFAEDEAPELVVNLGRDPLGLYRRWQASLDMNAGIYRHLPSN